MSAPPTDDSMLRWAVWYARLGYPVFPLHSVDEGGGCTCGKADCGPNTAKHPRTKNGVLDATTAGTVIRGWWQRWPDANVAIACGLALRLVVVDVDLHEHSGFGTLLELETALGKLPETATAQTGSGGHHRLFRTPEGIEIRNKVALGPGLDVRAWGGYIVAPPSLHLTGTRYTWLRGKTKAGLELAELPAAWVAHLAQPKPATAAPARAIGTGNRNASLTALAGSMRRQGLDAAQIAAGLAGVNGKLVEPLPEAEVVKIAGSIGKKPAGPPAGAASTNGSQPGDSGKAGKPRMRTDLGNAERLIARHGQDLLYCEPLKGWFIWTGTHWQRDQDGAVKRLAYESVRAIYAEAADCGDPDERAELGKWAAKSEGAPRIAALLTLAQPFEEVAARPAMFDRDPWLLACENGTLDLRTGSLREHRRDDLITRCAPVVYDAAAACPVFTAFLDRIMASSAELLAFLARAVGYALSGDTGERCMFLLHGGGDNGKSTLLELLAGLLGPYATTAEAGTFLERQGERASNDLAALAGARFVAVSEGQSGQRLAENLVKRVTGRDSVTARFLFEEYFTFRPSFKLWLATNHKPEVRDAGDALWRRIRLIPFTVSIPKPEQDKALPEKLLTELPGILAWAVRGCLDWQRLGGLGEPEAVTAATLAYREEMDVLGPFIAERCLLDPQATARSGALYQAYTAVCEQASEKPLSQRSFGIRLAERGLRATKTTGGARQWAGIRLREPGESAEVAPLSATQAGPVADGGAVADEKRDSHIPTYISPREGDLGEIAPLSATRHLEAPEAEPTTPSPAPSPIANPPYRMCGVASCTWLALSEDEETGRWCPQHGDREQLLDLALLLDWPVVELGAEEVVSGPDGWRAYAQIASDVEIAFAQDALGEVVNRG